MATRYKRITLDQIVPESPLPRFVAKMPRCARCNGWNQQHPHVAICHTCEREEVERALTTRDSPWFDVADDLVNA